MAAHIASTCIPAICSSQALRLTNSYWYRLGAMPAQLFNTRERVALAWAETVTRVAETSIPDVDYETATAEFSDKELVI